METTARLGMIPESWLPECAAVRRVVMHWTAGGPSPSFFERLHYHFLIDREGVVHRGRFPVGRWPPHTRRLNTGSIGIALCGMAQATPAPLRVGPSPITAAQLEALPVIAAQVLGRYGLPVTEQTLLSHCEVPRVYGRPQRGKWDIAWVPGLTGLAPQHVGDRLRNEARAWWRRGRG